MTQPTISSAAFPATPFEALASVSCVYDRSGEPVDEVLVRVTRVDGGSAFFHTIDLRVEGFRLAVPVAKIRPLEPTGDLMHKDGLVSFAL